MKQEPAEPQRSPPALRNTSKLQEELTSGAARRMHEARVKPPALLGRIWGRRHRAGEAETTRADSRRFTHAQTQPPSTAVARSLARSPPLSSLSLALSLHPRRGDDISR